MEPPAPADGGGALDSRTENTPYMDPASIIPSDDPFPAGPDPQLAPEDAGAARGSRTGPAGGPGPGGDGPNPADADGGPAEEEAVEGYVPPPDAGPDMAVWGAQGRVEAEENKLAAQMAELEVLLGELEAEEAAEAEAEAEWAAGGGAAGGAGAGSGGDLSASIAAELEAASVRGGPAAKQALLDRLQLKRLVATCKANLFQTERAELAARDEVAQVERFIAEAQEHTAQLHGELDLLENARGGLEAIRIGKVRRMVQLNDESVAAQRAAMARARRKVEVAEFANRDMQLEMAHLSELESEMVALEARVQAAAVTSAAAKQQKEVEAVERFRRRQAAYVADRARRAAEQRQRDAASLEAAKAGRASALARLRATMETVHVHQAAYDEVRAEALSTRTAALLSLKHNIDAAVEDMTARNAKRRSRLQTRDVRQKAEAAALLAQGLNPYEVFRRRAKDARTARDKAERLRLLKERENALAARMFYEDEMYERERAAAAVEREHVDRFQREMGVAAKEERVQRYMLQHTRQKTDLLDPTGMQRIYPSQAAVAKDGTMGTGRADPLVVAKMQRKYHESPDPLLFPGGRYGGPVAFEDEGPPPEDDLGVPSTPGAARTSGAASGTWSRGGSATGTGSMRERERPVVDLAKPEFPGLWTQATKKKTLAAADEDDADPGGKPDGGQEGPDGGSWRPKRPARSKLELEMLRTARAKQQANVTKTQVVCGREFKGQAFLPSPTAITFKDFEVGKRYKRRITMTNVSFSFNTFKVLELPDAYKDFFSVTYAFPGALSAGMTCDILVTFEPKLNDDIVTELPLLCETGPMSVPLVCTIKRAVVSVSQSVLDLGFVALAERRAHMLTVRNDGALAVEFSISDGFEEDEVDPKLAAFSFPARGTVPGYSSRDFEIAFSPPSEAFMEVELFGSHVDVARPLTLAFVPQGRDAPAVPDAALALRAVATPVPIFLPRRTLDYKTCVFGLTYRDHLVVSNRGKSALKVFLTPPKSLRGMLDVAPDLLYVQAGGEATFNVKFMPKEELMQRCAQHYDPETGTIRIPLRVLVPDQVLPVMWTLQAQLTSSDLELSPATVDFGTCPIGNSVSVELRITNKSDLPQKFGVTNIREDHEIASGKGHVDVTPGAGYGTLLPRETISRTVVWRPTAPVPCNFELTLKTLLGRQFVIPCSGAGTTLPLLFSATVLRFPATAIRDTVSLSFYVENLLKTKQTFQFAVPPGSNLKVSPLVDTVPGRGRLRIQVDHSPQPADVEHELPVRVGEDEAAAQEGAELEGDEQIDLDAEEEEDAPAPEPERSASSAADAGSEAEAQRKREAAEADQLSRTLRSRGSRRKIQEEEPVWCYRRTSQLACFIQGMEAVPMHVEVHTTAVEPELIVEGAKWNDEKGYYELNFGQVPIGHHQVKTPRIRNYGVAPVHPRADALDVVGTFSVLTAFRDIAPSDAHAFVIDFYPSSKQMFFEKLVLRSPRQTVRVALIGEGVSPSLEIQEGISALDLGDVFAGEEAEKSFTLSNTSTYDLSYALVLKGGHRNLNGLLPFYCRPAEGFIKAGSSQAVAVRFGPDHEYPYFEEVLEVRIPNQKEARNKIALSGRAWDRGLYVLGVDRPMADEEDVMAQLLAAAKRKAAESASEDAKPRPPSSKPAAGGKRPGSAASGASAGGEVMVVTFDAPIKPGETAKKTIEIGGLKAEAAGGKAPNGDYMFDPLSKEAAAAGWAVDVPKATIDAGGRKAVTFTFSPPEEVPSSSLAYFGLPEWAETSLPCVFKGGFPAPRDPKGTVVTFLLRCCVDPTGSTAVAVRTSTRQAARPTFDGQI